MILQLNSIDESKVSSLSSPNRSTLTYLGSNIGCSIIAVDMVICDTSILCGNHSMDIW